MSTTKAKDRKQRDQGMPDIDAPLSFEEQAKIYAKIHKATITLPILTPHQPAEGVNQ
jgi:hypothetical protein